MKKTTGYIWAILFLLLVICVDAYYQITESTIPIWQTEWFLWRAAGLFLILLIVLSYVLYKGSVSRKAELADFKIKLMTSQEAEWKRLAGELHDSVGQNLSAINIYLQQNIKALPEDSSDVKENLGAASNMLVETLDEVRRISTKLFPQQIERLGLTIAIQSMVTKLTTTTGIHFTLAIDNVDNLFPKETEIYFYRILQESLNNIIKHSKAANVNINIIKAVLFVTIDIEDDGIGFDAALLESAGAEKLGFGLLNLDERINMIRGTYKYNSEPGKGTKLHITIPIKKNRLNR
jgi:signal transduction histidine kinase